GRGRRMLAAGERPGSSSQAAMAAPPGLEVTSVTVLPAEDEPAETLDGQPPSELEDAVTVAPTVSDWLPGIRDEHEDDGGWQARWLDRPTWDRTVTPNVIRRTGARGPRPSRRR
ncbi:MAG TPA: hypothetical protein VNF73_12085, partial [Candidatus Saccharimonadales bacterium]|nr:hypothetical protein [Candidatus Saccharimonadales bacterium]